MVLRTPGGSRPTSDFNPGGQVREDRTEPVVELDAGRGVFPRSIRQGGTRPPIHGNAQQRPTLRRQTARAPLATVAAESLLGVPPGEVDGKQSIPFDVKALISADRDGHALFPVRGQGDHFACPSPPWQARCPVRAEMLSAGLIRRRRSFRGGRKRVFRRS